VDWLVQGLKSLPWVSEGGWMMLPIYVCSIVAVGFFFERLFALRRTTVIPPDFTIEAADLIDRGKIPEALTLCRRTSAPFAKIVERGLEKAECDRLIVREAMEEGGRQNVALLNRYLIVLGTIAGITPLLGLLGTVSGMISTFDVIRLMGVGHAEELSGGISEALLSTAAGLSVAIPTMVAFRYLQGRVSRLVLELEDRSSIFADKIIAAGVKNDSK
jgi:biopolymer transport protein ExbB